MRRGHKPLDPAVVKRFAKAMILHLLTHPARVGKMHGVSAEYVRRQYRDLAAPDMVLMAEKLEKLLDG